MFVPNAESMLSSDELYKLYTDAFKPFETQAPLLAPAQLIGNVVVVNSQVQFMVQPEISPSQLVRGIARREVYERFRCHRDS